MIRRTIGLGVGHPVLLNLLFWVIIAFGIVSWTRMPKSEFPDVQQNRVVVTAGWPGASAEEVEDGLLEPLEDAVERVAGVRHVFGEATEGRAMLTIDLVRGGVAELVEEDVRRAVDDVDGLPDDTIGPMVAVSKVELPLLHVALTGDPRRRDLAEALAAELLELPGIDAVNLEGIVDPIIEVRLDGARAAALGIGPLDVAAALEAASTGLPAGSVRQDDESVLVRTAKGITRVADLGGVPLLVSGGSEITVGQIATIQSVDEEPDVLDRLNGQPAILLQPSRSADADALQIVPAVKAWAAARSAALPPGMALVPHDDSAYVLSDRMQVLASNGFVGLMLVALLLGAFVGWRNAALVIWGIPVAYLGAIGALHLAGESMNLISMFGLLLVTGIIVDDAVVIVENVQRHLELGKDRLTAAIDGTSEVLPAVFAATLTTCLAFAPLLMLEGVIGRVMRIVPTVVILSLCASLFEAFVILPGHLAHHAQEATGEGDNAPTRWLKRIYTPVLAWIVRPRGRWIALAAMTLFIAGSLSLAGWMRVTLTSEGHPIVAIVEIGLPPSSTREEVLAVVRATESLASHTEPNDLLRFFRVHMGRLGKPDTKPLFGDRYAQLVIGFRNDKSMADATWAFMRELETLLRRRPEVVELDVEVLTGSPPVGKPVDVRVRGEDGEAVAASAAALIAHLAERPGVANVRTDSGLGNDTFELRVDPARAARVGLREQDIAYATRAAIEGVEALELVIDGQTTLVKVRQPRPSGAADIADLAMPLPGGSAELRLRQVADVVRTIAVERIGHVDGERGIRITADLDPASSTATLEQLSLEQAFADSPGPDAGVRLLFGGEAADTSESFARLPYAAALALVLIYAVLAVQFRSYLQPLIILAAVPFGLAGVVLGLFTFGMDLTLIAMVGVVGLIGIVVNDSLVLVDFINQRRREGLAVQEAVFDASVARLRPILITTVTTVAGLLPLGLGLTGQEPLLAPMAIAIAIGLSFATVLTLVGVPVLYLVLDDVAAPLRGALTADPPR